MTNDNTELGRAFWSKYRLLANLRDICYTDASNPLFDAIYDNLEYQVHGFSERADDFSLVTKGCVREITDLVNEVQDYLIKTNNIEEPNWIFG